MKRPLPAKYIPRLLGICILFVCSCSKDGDGPGKSKTALLSSAPWKISAHTISPALDLDGDGQADDTDIFATYEACDRDDLTSFSSNGTGVFSEGPTKCDPGDPSSFNFTWEWKNNETVLSISGDDRKLAELSASTLKLSMAYEDGGTIYTETLTFTH